jgi:hypothetical protein
VKPETYNLNITDMKKCYYLILFAAFIFYTSNAYCQRGTTVGIDGSFNSTWIFWPNAYGIKEFKNTKTSYYVPSYGQDFSFSIGQNFVNIFGIKAGIGMNTLNQKFNNTVEHSKRDLQLKYLEIPVMLRLATPGEHLILHLMLGPQFGFLTSASQTNMTVNDISVNNLTIKNSDGKTVDYFKTKDIKDRYNSLDILGVIDLGCDIYLSDKFLLNIGLRLHGSINDINKSDWKILSPDVDYYSSRNLYGGVNVGLTYALHNWYKMK